MPTLRRPRDEGELDNEDKIYVHMRAEDRSIWMKVAYYLEKYKIIVWLAFWALTAFGFDFQMPGTILRHLQYEVDTLKMVNDLTRDGNKKMLDSMKLQITIIRRLKCIELKDKPNVRFTAGLECSDILGEGR